ncbi:MAG: RNA polymerase sigma-70 factor, partial [Candidatus Binataceae bacterium]
SSDNVTSFGGCGRAVTFNQYRSLLFSIAYRMLGSVADAEDMLQEAFIRWQAASDNEIHSPKAFLVTIVSRLCITQLHSARARREAYVGQWLPEPLLTDQQSDPFDVIRADESLSMALLILLERLSPLERAVFLLHEVFGFQHTEIAKTLGKNDASCRQILHRARAHVGAMRRRFEATAQEQRDLLDRFLDAAREGNLARLIALLLDDAALHVDADSKTAFPNVIRGADKVARALVAGTKDLPAGIVLRPTQINGDPGIISYVDGRPFSALALDIDGDKIRNVYIVANPRKLAHLPVCGDMATNAHLKGRHEPPA